MSPCQNARGAPTAALCAVQQRLRMPPAGNGTGPSAPGASAAAIVGVPRPRGISARDFVTVQVPLETSPIALAYAPGWLRASARDFAAVQVTLKTSPIALAPVPGWLRASARDFATVQVPLETSPIALAHVPGWLRASARDFVTSQGSRGAFPGCSARGSWPRVEFACYFAPRPWRVATFSIKLRELGLPSRCKLL